MSSQLTLFFPPKKICNVLIAVLSPDRASLPLAINSAGAPLRLHRAQARAGDGDGALWVSTPRTWVMNEPRCYLNTRVLQQVTTAQITSPRPGTRCPHKGIVPPWGNPTDFNGACHRAWDQRADRCQDLALSLQRTPTHLSSPSSSSQGAVQ